MVWMEVAIWLSYPWFIMSFKLGISSSEGYRGYMVVVSVVNSLLDDVNMFNCIE